MEANGGVKCWGTNVMAADKSPVAVPGAKDMRRGRDAGAKMGELGGGIIEGEIQKMEGMCERAK